MLARTIVPLVLLLAASGCGGGGAVSDATPPDGSPPAPTLAALGLSPASGTVEVGGTFQLTATPADGNGSPLPNAPAATWTTSDAGRATVDATGRVSGVAQGGVAITASLTHGGVTRTATAQLTVVPRAAVLAALELSPAQGTVAVGGTLPLTLIARDAAGAPIAGAPAATWTSSDPTRATVGSGVVTGVAAGATTITASVTLGGVTRTAGAVVVVTAPPQPSTALVQGIGHAFVPGSVTISPGGTVTWTMVDEEHDVTWTGAAPPGGNIPRIDRGRSASRVFPAAGTFTYRCARHDNHNETGTVTVQAGGGGAPVFTSLTLSPPAPSVAVGATVQLVATPRDGAGAPLAGLPAATWTTSDATRATVSAAGLVTGVAAGTATVTATVTQGATTRTATATVTVGASAPPPPPQPGAAIVTTPGVTFNPTVVTIAAGGQVTWQISGARHNVTFSGAAPTGGNVPDTDAGGSATRTFPVAGTYDYQCTRHSGMTGRVVVQ